MDKYVNNRVNHVVLYHGYYNEYGIRFIVLPYTRYSRPLVHGSNNKTIGAVVPDTTLRSRTDSDITTGYFEAPLLNQVVLQHHTDLNR